MTGKRDISPRLIDRAKQLRRAATFPERLLWGVLRGGHLEGLKFRRQEAIGQFVVDFCCYSARLVVELDGVSHEGRQRADRLRTEYLEQQGFEVVRFLNDDVIDDVEAVALSIARIAQSRLAKLASGNRETLNRQNAQPD